MGWGWEAAVRLEIVATFKVAQQVQVHVHAV
jgi:hypothetical protein